MADPLTTSIRFTQPTVGGDSGTWGTLLNGNWSYADVAINQTVTVSVPDTNVTLVADGSSSDQARYLRYNFTGALTANRTITLPANVKVGWASNNTTGGFNIILSAGGTTLAIRGTGWTQFYCDGTNVTIVERGGTPTNDNAPAGSVGELISSVISVGSAVTLTTNTNATVTSISLTPGDWDVWGTVVFGPNATGITGCAGNCSTTAGIFDAYEQGSGFVVTTSFTTNSTLAFPTGMRRLSVAATTTVYLLAFMTFSGGTGVAYGGLFARRRR